MRSHSSLVGRKKLPVPVSGIEPTTLTLKGKAPVCIATFTLHKDPWLMNTMKDIFLIL